MGWGRAGGSWGEVGVKLKHILAKLEQVTAEPCDCTSRAVESVAEKELWREVCEEGCVELWRVVGQARGEKGLW